jgi:phosphate transport system permease protein
MSPESRIISERKTGWIHPKSFWSRIRSGDEIAYLITAAAAVSIFAVTALLFYELWVNSGLARHKFGWRFLVTSTWDPVAEEFGALPFIYGTVVTSILALLIAVPLGLGAAIFLAELAPPKISDFLTLVIELLAAVPSVIFGLLGVFLLLPALQPVVGVVATLSRVSADL